ncbi:MAG: Amuc_1099 family pilus-like system protein [Verrucomicrobiales bacterium]
MDWVSKNYEKIILLLIAAVTGYFAFTLILKATGFASNFVIPSVTPSQELPANRKGDVEAATQTLTLNSYLAPPKIAVAGEGGKSPNIFISVPIVERDGIIYNMSEEEPRLHPPVSNAWLLENGLEFLRNDVLDLDPDLDFFSNREEWEAKTKPGDKEDHPSMLRKLALLQRTQTNYYLEFKANNHPSYQIERAVPKRKTWFVKEDEKFGEDRFRVDSYEKAEGRTEQGITRDMSVLGVTDLVRGDQFQLILRQRLNLPTYFAQFQYSLGEVVKFKVKEGDTFVVPSGDETRYKLLKVGEDTATITSLPAPGSGEIAREFTIGKPGGP